MKILTIFLIAFGILCSCRKQETKDNDEMARNLFTNSSLLLKDFSEKINNANDSTEVDSLWQELEHKLVEINFSVPPETDLKLTEEENDSIYKLMEDLKRTRNEILEGLSKNRDMELSVDKDTI